MAPRVCSNCGSTNAADDVFCAKCGSKLMAPGTADGEHNPTNSPPAGPSVRYAPVMLPGWLTFGMILVVLSGVLILVGFLIFVVGTASLGTTTTLDDLKSYLEWFAALAGVGFFLGALGWALDRVSVSRRRA